RNAAGWLFTGDQNNRGDLRHREAGLVKGPGTARSSRRGGVLGPAHMMDAGGEGTAMAHQQSPDPSTEAGLGLRKEPRTRANRAGWIAVKKGAQLQGCFVWDESDHGAKLTV